MGTTTQLIELKTCTRCGIEKPRATFSKRGRTNNSWCKDCHKAYMAVYIKTYPRRKPTKEELRRINYRKVHGITIEQYNSLLVAQGGKCAICATTTPGSDVGNFTVDHGHSTGRIRGLLCRPCNMALGLFKDSASALRAAADYLEAAE